jgi:hypothetical protein
VDVSEGRSLRKRPEKAAEEKPKAKPALKKAGTMQNTAKEGKAFLKRSKKGPAKKKEAEAVAEEEEEEKNGEAEAASE